MINFMRSIIQAILSFLRHLFKQTQVLSGARIVRPVGSVSSAAVIIEYVLTNSNNHPTDILVTYSVAGAPFRSANADTNHPQHEGGTRLSTSSAGETHFFVWDWQMDIGYNPVNDVVLQILPSTASGNGQPARSIPFTISAPVVPANQKPSIQILPPSGVLLQGENVEIGYLLMDDESDIVHIEVEYSLDNGVNFRPATESNHPANEGTSGLTSSPQGESHKFIWKATDDLPAIPATGVLIRIQSFDSQRGGSDTTAPFSVGTTTSNHPPSVRILSPQANSEQGSAVELRYVLSDDNSDPVRIEVNYSIDNGLTFLPATEASGLGSEGLTNLSSGPTGITHIFFWKAIDDLAALPATGIIVQLQAFDSAPGGIASIGSLSITDNYPPLIQIFSPQANSRQSVPVEIQYVLTDREGDVCSLEAFYSLDNGLTFLSASSHNSGDGVSGLVSDPSGAVRIFMWDAGIDLNTLSQQDVLFKIQVKDRHPGGISSSAIFDIDLPVAPSVSILQPTGGIWGDPVPVVYQLSHPGGPQQLPVSIDYSLDNGITFTPASEALQVNSEGLINLQTDVNPVNHFFAWDALRDIPSLDQVPKDNILLRVRATRNAETGEDVSDPFTVDSGFVGVPRYDPSLTGVKRPEIEQVFTPPDHEGIHVAARFLLKHEDNARSNVRVQFSVNGGVYENATPAFYSDQLTNLPAPKINAQYRFIWNAASDFRRMGLQSGLVRLRLTPYIGPYEGAAAETNTFTFTIKDPGPVPSPVVNPPLNGLRIIKVYGDNQHVVAGQLAPDNLVIELRDMNNQVVQGARLTFSVNRNSPVTAIFEDDPDLRTTTDYYGRAGIRVRPQQGTGGAFKVLVTVVGVPGVTESFSIESHVPVIRPLPNNPTDFAYGTLYSFYFHLDIGQPLYDKQFRWDNNHPVKFKVTPHNAEVSVSHPDVPGPFAHYQDNSIIKVDVTPSLPGGTSTMATETFRLKIEVPDLAGVQPLEIINQFVVTPFNTTHLKDMNVTNNGFGPAYEVVEDLRLHLKVVSGHGPQDPNYPGQLFPLKAFPGGTLSTPFKVEVSDGVESYVHTTDRRYIDCTETLTKEDLKIQWRAIGGVLSTSPNKGTDTHLEVPVTGSVYFTPTGNAPWSVTANFNGIVYDHKAVPIDYYIRRNTTNSAGNPVVVTDRYCIFQPGLPVAIRRTFFIHLPDAIGFEDVTKATANTRGPLVNQLKSGMLVKLLVQGLSPVTANSVFEKVKLETFMASGLTVKKYTGTSLVFKQDITLRLQTNGDLQSDNIVIVQNESKTTAGIGHGILPLAQIKLSVFNLLISVKTAGLKRKRLRFGTGSLDGDTEFAYESPVGTSPTGGASNSITLHNGEFIIDKCDLSFPSRMKDISMCRTYRSQVLSLLDPEDEYEAVEAFGPGWFLDAGMYLEVAHKHLRFWDDRGVYFDYPYQYPGKGQFIFITLNKDITDDQSAFEVRDRHRNVYHFNIDGTLRFIKDRFGNKYEYEYNEKAQLVKIKDCMQPNARAISIRYFDDTRTNRESYLANKIKEIEDFEGRKTSYEYFTKAPSGATQIGAPGFLKKVILPECETVMEGSTAPVNYNSYEIFEYAQNNRSGWHLKSVTSLTSKGSEYTCLSNEYDGEGRISKQTEGQGDYEVLYTLDGANNTVSDYKNKNGFTTKFLFPPSAWWDNTAPIELTDPENHVTSLKYNHDGHLTYIKPPKGGYTEYVYDEESQFARNHADVLAEIQTSDAGEKRIYTSTYSTYHFPLVSVNPEGNLPGVDPALYESVNNYDHQRSTGDAGNVVDSFGPRTMNMVYVPLSATDRQPTWIEENPKQEYVYNSFGQVTSHIDERGVKTEYYYYAADNPTEGSIGQAGGGLLAQVRFDTEENAKRTLHLPGDDARPQTKRITYLYNRLGYIKEITDQDDIKTVHILNKLGKAIKTEIGNGVPGLYTTYENHFGPGGEIVRYREIQPGTGGYEITMEYEFYEDGLLKSKSMQMNSVVIGTETWLYDNGDRLTTLSDSRTAAQTSHEYDKRDLEVKTTIVSGSLSLSTERNYTEDGSLKEVKDPSGDTTTYEQNGFGEMVKVINADGVATETILNEAGVPVILLKKDVSGAVIYAQEIVVDEYTRVRRCYDLRLTKNTSGSGSKFSKIPENMGIRSNDYLSALRHVFKDSGFAPQDGRTVTDIVWSISGDIVQRKTDELQQLMSRQDGLGRIVETDNREGIRINTAYSDASFEVETSTTANSETTPQDIHEIKLRHKFDLAGRLDSEQDANNRSTFFNYDGQMLTGITNAENAVVEFKYDGLNNLEEAKTNLFVSGQNTDPSLQAGIGQYNPGNMIMKSMKFDNMGRLVSCKNMAGHEYQYIYKNNLLSEIIYPAARSTGNQSVKEVFGYNDNSGRLETYTDPSGAIITYAYDKGRLTGITTGQQSLSVRYNENGYIEEIEDTSNPSGMITYEYDSVGNLIASTEMVNGQPKKTEYLYDGVGRLLKTVYSANEFLENVYDEKTGFLKEVKDQQGTFATYTYFGDRIKAEDRNGMVTKYLFINGELVGREVTGPSQGDIKTEYKFDIMDRLIETTETFGSHSTTCRYDYDSAGRTLKEEITLSSLPQPLVIRYYYDGDNNIRKIVRDEVNAQTGDIEQVTREQEFDERGFMITYTETRQVILPVVQP